MVITGASSGLGYELALSYAAPDVFLGLIGRNTERLAACRRACEARGAQVATAAIDVADAATLQPWLLSWDAHRPVDLVIANAGVLAGPHAEGSLDGVELATLQIRVNLLGVINVVEILTPSMLARGRGQVCVVSSTAAYRGLPYMPAYAASKAGVRIYGEGVRARLAPLGVDVSVVVPSFFDSPMTTRFHGPKPLMISTPAAAAHVKRGLDARRPRIVFPRRIGLLMQLLDVIPARWGDRLLRTEGITIEKPPTDCVSAPKEPVS